jgi:hypothetical protein
MGRIARTTDDVSVGQRTEARLRELDRRVTTVLGQDTSWPRGLIGYVSSTTTKASLTAVTNLLGLRVSLTAGRSYRIASQVGLYVDGSARGTAILRIVVDGTIIGKASQVLEPFGVVEVGTIEKVLIPVASAVDVDVVLAVEPTAGLTYGAYCAGDYPLWFSITDTGPSSSVTAVGTIY